MRRRRVLLAVSAALGAVTGCGSRGKDQPTDSPAPTDGGANAFRAAIERLPGIEVQTLTPNGSTWTVEYHTELCCGDPFAAQQATLARNFSSLRPEAVSLRATAFHECTEIRWRVPAQLARNHRQGSIDAEAFLHRIRNLTTRTSNC